MDPSSGDKPAIDVVDAGLGVALLVLAAWLVIKQLRHSRRPERTPAQLTAASPAKTRSNARLVGLGVVMMVTNVSTILLSLGALREIARADLDVPAEAAALLVLVAVAMTPVWLPLAVDIAAPQATARALAPISRFLDRHATVIAASVSAVFGVYLLVRSVTAA